MIKRYLSVAMVICMFIGCIQLSGCSEKNVCIINSSDAMVIANYDGHINAEEDIYSSFAAYALEEAALVIADINKCGPGEAKRELADKGYVIETTFDTEIFQKAEEAVGKIFALSGSVPVAVAVTDLNGALKVLLGNTGDTDYANTPTYAGSAIKPLSVYMQIIESGKANWSSVQLDTPVKKVVYNTELVDWPQNASGIYSGKETTVAEGMKLSLNTVAVKWLQMLGVETSMDFVEENLPIDFSKEREIAQNYSDEEILANVALGYLRGGVTVSEMAACYQIFAAEGIYTGLYSVTGIYDQSGDKIYQIKPEKKRVISTETAFIMNKLLQKVTEPGGTGENAAECGIMVAGKTGTTTGSDNWFVGVSPEFSCAVWHGTDQSSPSLKNTAPEIFSEIIKNITVRPEKSFPLCENVIQKAYCAETGKLLSEDCKKMEVGWFAVGNIPEKCSGH